MGTLIEDVLAVAMVVFVVGFSLDLCYSSFSSNVAAFALSGQIDRAHDLLDFITSEKGSPEDWGDLSSDPRTFGLAGTESYALDPVKLMRVHEGHPFGLDYEGVRRLLNVRSFYLGVYYPLCVENLTSVESGTLSLSVKREEKGIEGTARFYTVNSTSNGFDAKSVPIVGGRCALDIDAEGHVLAVIAESKYAGLRGFWLYNSRQWWGKSMGWKSSSYIANGWLYFDTNGQRVGHVVEAHVLTRDNSIVETMAEIGPGRYGTRSAPLETDCAPYVLFYYDATTKRWITGWIHPTPTVFGEREGDQALVRSSARMLGELFDVELGVRY